MKNKIVVIIGPTASGKTNLAIKIAQNCNGEIINADAFQVYKELNIGTARASEEEKKQAIFHLDGEISIYDEWDIKIFKDKAIKLINDLIKENKLPIIIGGSHLYIDALIYNYDLENTPPRTNKYEKYTKEELFGMLLKKNEETANKIGINNKRRLERALEIYDFNGSLVKKNEQLYKPIIIQTFLPREELYQKINKRVEIMIKNGWQEEVEKIYKKDNEIEKLQALKAIGYKTILESIKNSIPIDIEKIKLDTRHYAKKQLTWIKHHYNDQILYTGMNLNEIIKTINNV